MQPSVENYAGYSDGMTEFLHGCNQQQGDVPFCLYGIVSALWVLAVANWEDRAQAESLLRGAGQSDIDPLLSITTMRQSDNHR